MIRNTGWISAGIILSPLAVGAVVLGGPELIPSLTPKGARLAWQAIDFIFGNATDVAVARGVQGAEVVSNISQAGTAQAAIEAANLTAASGARAAASAASSATTGAAAVVVPNSQPKPEEKKERKPKDASLIDQGGMLTGARGCDSRLLCGK